jgi:hypothetical protein
VQDVHDLVSYDVLMTPQQSVQIANDLADRAALEPFVRAIAAPIVAGITDVRRDGPERIAEWVRENVLYTQEAVGREILQGPRTTLTLRTGDCDDLSILWAALCRSINLDALVCGLSRAGTHAFFHAVGWCDDQLYELSLDHTYGGERRPTRIDRLPAGVVGWAFDVRTGTALAVAPDGHALTSASSRHGMAGASHASRFGASLAQSLRQHGIDLTSEAIGSGGVEGAVGQLVGPLAAGLGGSGAVARVLGIASKTAASAASSGVLSAVGGLGAAAGPIGAAVVVAAALGKALSALSHARRNAARAGNRYLVAVDTVAAVLRPVTQLQTDVIRARMHELVPLLAQTDERRGRRGKTIVIASLADLHPPGQATWVDGTRGKKRGVFETFRPRIKRQTNAMNAHAQAAITLAEALAQIPLAERRAAFAALVLTNLGRGGLRGLPVPPPAARTPETSGPLVGLGAALAAYALLR